VYESLSSPGAWNEPGGAARTTAAPGNTPVGKVFRALCVLTAIANMGGNALLLVAHERIFRWLGLPVPDDLYTFTSVLGFSFTSGVVALMVALRPVHAVPLLIVAIVGKALFALITLAFHVRLPDGLEWPWLVFAGWDATFVGVFWLYMIYLSRPELLVLNQGAIVSGSARPRTRKALLLHYSLSGNARGAIARVQAGLVAKGYQCDAVRVQPVERELFSFPFRSLWSFGRILVRAVLRRRAAIEPIDVSSDHDYDLIVVASQTWMVGTAAPVEELFLDARTRRIFLDRDVAIVNVSRGLWRRAQAMVASHVQAAGGHLIAASAHGNPGPEPFRTLSLFVFLLFGGKVPGWVPPLLRLPSQLSADAQQQLERMGERLAMRPKSLLSEEVLTRLRALDHQLAQIPRRITEDTWDAVVAPVVQASVQSVVQSVGQPIGASSPVGEVSA